MSPVLTVYRGLVVRRGLKEALGGLTLGSAWSMVPEEAPRSRCSTRLLSSLVDALPLLSISAITCRSHCLGHFDSSLLLVLVLMKRQDVICEGGSEGVRVESRVM